MSRFYILSIRWGIINIFYVYINYVIIIMLLIVCIFIGYVIFDMFDDYLIVY